METLGVFEHFCEHTENEQTAAILTLAEAMVVVSYRLKDLGNGDAASSMGAMEALGKIVSEGLESVAASVESLAGAVAVGQDGA